MFVLRYHIKFKDGSVTSLYGEDYFGDKKVFWDAHQTMLTGLCNKVCNEGFPVFINDAYLDMHERMDNLDQFNTWLKKNHPKESCDCSELKTTF